MPTRGSGIEPFHFVGIEPFKMVGIEPFAMVGIEPFKKGARIEPFKPGSGNASGPGGLVVGGDGAFGAGDAGSAALVADALNATTASIIRWDDAPQPSTSFGPQSKIWQRDEWVRAELAHQALMSRLRHIDGTLWYLPQADAQGVVRPQKLLSLAAPTPQDLPALVNEVLTRKDQRPDRTSEILVQIAHFWPFWTTITGIDPARHPRTYELMQIAASLSPAVGQPIKHFLDVRRPHTMTSLVQPMIPVPGHAAFPSGHATGAYLFVEVMGQLLVSSTGKPPPPQLMQQLERMAARIADNRVVAGVHYSIDGAAGELLGRLLGRYFVACCTSHSGKPGGSTPVEAGEGRVVPGDTERPATYELKPLQKVPVTTIEPLPDLWAAARIELGL
jgi:hypothetical protein